MHIRSGFGVSRVRTMNFLRDHEDQISWNLSLEVKADDPKFSGHPLRGRREWKHSAVPLVLHSDKVPITKKHSMTIVDWSFLLSEMETWDTCLLIFAFPDHCAAKATIHGDSTWDCAWRYIAQSFNALFQGKKPPLNPFNHEWQQAVMNAEADQDIAQGKYFGVVWALNPDLDLAANDWGLPHFNTPTPCWLCKANRSDTNLRDYSSNAAWRATVIGTAIGRRTRVSNHPVWSIIGVSRFSYTGDWMHMYDLGPDQHVS